MSGLAEAIPNPEVARTRRLQKATEQSTLILTLQIDDVDLQQDAQQDTTISVNAEAEIVDIVKGEGPLSIGDVVRLLYTADYVRAKREWKAYETEARGGYVGPPPEPAIRRLRKGDLITAYLNRDVDRRFLVPNHIELHSQQAIQTVELSEVARVDVGEWVVVRMPNSIGVAEIRLAGVGRGGCPGMAEAGIHALCRNVRTDLILDGMIYRQVHYSGPPRVLIAGYAVRVVSSKRDEYEIELVDAPEWSALWSSGSQDSFSHGCGGGITGGYSRTEILRNGRIIKRSGVRALDAAETISIEREDPELAEEIFVLLKGIDFDTAGESRRLGSWDCEYKIMLGDQRLVLRLGEHNPEALNARLRKAGQLLEGVPEGVREGTN